MKKLITNETVHKVLAIALLLGVMGFGQWMVYKDTVAILESEFIQIIQEDNTSFFAQGQ